MRARTLVTFSPSGEMRQKPRLVVSRKSFVTGSIARPLTYGGFFVKSTMRVETDGGGLDEVASATLSAVPASASSHSASDVKPTITPSIQYWERTASFGRR